jgi:hypothetical protein
VGFWSFGSSGFSDKNFYKSAGFTITESPTEFLEYVGKQTGKEWEAEPDNILSKKEIERIIEGIGLEPTYPHKTYRILDSLDGIPLDTRIPLSEWIPPFLQRVLFIKNDEFKAVYVCDISKDGLNVFDGVSNLILSDLDGHWMRIV